MTENTLAERIGRYVDSSGLSAREIERRADLPHGTLPKLTAGKNLNPKLGTISGLASVFGCKPWDLLPGYTPDGGGGDLVYLDPDQIDVETNPRTVFANDAMQELAASIHDRGILVPLLVRPGHTAGRFVLVAGERRLRAVHYLRDHGNWSDGEKIPASVVEDIDELAQLELALIENIQREDLTAYDEANAYRKLKERHGLSNRDIARKVGKSPRHIDYCMAFLDLHPAARNKIEAGMIAFAAVRHLSRLAPLQQQALVDQVAAGKLAPTLDAISQAVGMILSTPKANRTPPEQTDIEDGINVHIKLKGHSRLTEPLAGTERAELYRAKDFRCEACIDLLEHLPGSVKGGWKSGFIVSFQLGDQLGVHSLPTLNDVTPKHPTRNAALAAGARRVAEIAVECFTSTRSTVTDAQRREARKLLLWANNLLTELRQEGEPIPESPPAGGRLAGNKTTVNRGGGPTNEEIAREATAAFVPPDPEPRLRPPALPVDTRPGATNYIDPRTGEQVAPAGIEDEPDEPDHDQIGDEDFPVEIQHPWIVVSATYPGGAVGGNEWPHRVELYNTATDTRAIFTREVQT